MRLKKYLIKKLIELAQVQGYDLSPSWRRSSQPLARHLKQIFDRYAVDCVMDVGGNLGQYHDMLREEVGYAGLILSFEPVKKYVDILNARAVSDPNWRIFDFALGSADAIASINVTKSPGLNSFLNPRTDVVQEFWSADSITETQQVVVKTLDGIFEEVQAKYAFRAPYLKLDTQGFDLEVLKGATSSLPKILAMQTEASVRALYQQMPTYQATIDYMNNAGFDLSGMFPVSQDASLRLIEFDCLMVNDAFAHG